MKTVILTVLIAYIIGVVICFLMLITEVNGVYRYPTKRQLLSSVFRNTWKFWLASWYGIMWIILKRKIK